VTSLAETPIDIEVELGDRSYDVIIGHDVLAQCAQRLKPFFPRGRAVVVTDEHVAALHLDTLTNILTEISITLVPVILPAGENSKSFRGLEHAVNALLDENVERGEAIIALGGGVVGDLAGFAAAITKRGVDFIQIPTTLLAQVDSSVGGKTGINTRHGKNFAGAFHQPRLVIADTAFLDTLPEREVRAGYAEIVKAALIGDAPLFERLESAGPEALSAGHLTEIIAAAVRFKANIIVADEREAGQRALLNLGHTFAHAFEADAPKDQIRHGEAVAAGLAMAFQYSAARGLCTHAEADQVAAHLRAVGLPDGPKSLAHTQWSARSLIDRMRDDKKNQAGRITLILAHGIGNAYIDHDTDEKDLVCFMEMVLK
jgi:3-dehydroquinate synthase